MRNNKTETGQRDQNGTAKLKTVYDSRIHGSVPISEGTSKLVSKGSGTGIKLVSQQLSGRRAKSKTMFAGGRNTNSKAIRGAAGMAGAWRNRQTLRGNESRAERAFGNAGTLLSVALSQLNPQQLVELLASFNDCFDLMHGEWVTTWLFHDVTSKNEMVDVIKARFVGETLRDTLIPHSRSLIYSDIAQCYGTRTIWKDANLFQIILAASLTRHKKTCVYIGNYDSWYYHDRMYQKAIAAWDENGIFGEDPELTELLKRHIGFYRQEKPLLRVV